MIINIVEQIKYIIIIIARVSLELRDPNASAQVGRYPHRSRK